MTLFQCPLCDERVKALADVAGHHCPAAKRHLVMFVKVEEENA